jgi:hypothetical protein
VGLLLLSTLTAPGLLAGGAAPLTAQPLLGQGGSPLLLRVTRPLALTASLPLQEEEVSAPLPLGASLSAASPPVLMAPMTAQPPLPLPQMVPLTAQAETVKVCLPSMTGVWTRQIHSFSAGLTAPKRLIAPPR